MYSKQCQFILAKEYLQKEPLAFVPGTWNKLCWFMGNYRPPRISAESTIFLTSSSSSLLSLMFAAAEFSSKRKTLFVPGIGIIYVRMVLSHCTSSPWARSHASESCPRVQPVSCAIFFSARTSSRFLSKFSSEKRGEILRKSPSPKSSLDLIWPVRNHRPRGE